MSEKAQRTATSMREIMLNRYGVDFDHKHNKDHLLYRRHWRTHPSQSHLPLEDGDESTRHNTEGIRNHRKKSLTGRLRKRYMKASVH